MDAFLELGKSSLPPASDVLRGSFDAALDRAKQGGTLTGESAVPDHPVAGPHVCLLPRKCPFKQVH